MTLCQQVHPAAMHGGVRLWDCTQPVAPCADTCNKFWFAMHTIMPTARLTTTYGLAA